MRRLRAPSVWMRRLTQVLGDRRFWVVQLLTVLINVLIGMLWSRSLAGLPYAWAVPMIDAANLLFLIPVLYAAVNFGLVGGVATAAVVAVFRGAFLLFWIDPVQVWILGTVYASILAAGVVVGQRVEREVGARREAEAARNAARASEAQFRSLFENSPAPTLLLDRGGRVRRANPAAAELFDHRLSELPSAALVDVIGPEMATAIADGRHEVFQLHGAGEQARFARAVVSQPSGSDDGLLLVVFSDVSEERRQLGAADAYAEAMLRAHEEERAQIARELHDEPLQQVVQLCHQLDHVETLDGSAAAALSAARRTAEGIADELRRLATGLRPPALEELGLPAALRVVSRATQQGAVGRLAATVEVRGRERRLDPLVELNLFRIGQEAVRNAERHACASRVAITLSYGRKEVSLCVTDNGRGLPDNADGRPHAGRMGLAGMRERARLLGARFQLASVAGEGTRIEVSVREA